MHTRLHLNVVNACVHVRILTEPMGMHVATETYSFTQQNNKIITIYVMEVIKKTLNEICTIAAIFY